MIFWFYSKIFSLVNGPNAGVGPKQLFVVFTSTLAKDAPCTLFQVPLACFSYSLSSYVSIDPFKELVTYGQKNLMTPATPCQVITIDDNPKIDIKLLSYH